MNPLLDAALRYAKRGWYVVPCRKSRPLMKGWPTKSTLDENVIRAWWDDGAEFAHSQIGIHLERSGLFALDVDPRNGGDVTIGALEAEHGPLPRTCHQRSGGGGEHIVMRAPPDLELRGKFPGGVDVKWRGVIVAAPSLHKRTRAPYHWVSDGEPPPCPEPWLAPLESQSRASGDIVADAWQASIGPLSKGDEEFLSRWLENLGPRGQGNGTTLKAIARVHHWYGLSVADGRRYLDEWNASCGKPHADLDRQIERCATWGGHKHPRGQGRIPDGLHRWVKNLVKREAFGVELKRARRDVERAMGVDKTAIPAPLFEPSINLFKREHPPTPWLVRDLLTEGGVAVIATHPKSGKTWAGTEIAMAVATGTAAFGAFETSDPKRAVYFYAEDGAVSVRNRLRALAASRGLTVERAMENIVEQTRGRYIDLCDLDSVALIVASCRRFGDVALLVVDPMRDVHSGAENDSDAMRNVMRALRVIGDLLHCTVMFIHHAAKSSGEGGRGSMRGSSAIHGAIDCGIYFGDLSGDGRNVFRNAVRSEVKGARSAGAFDLVLTVEDNANGEAIRADWSVDRPNDADRLDREVDAMVAKVAEMPTTAWRDVRGKFGMSGERADALRDRAIELGRLRSEQEDYTDTRGRKRKREVLRVVEVAP